MFSLVSSPIKERLYIGEASVATIAGVIFGPFCLKWFIPTSWGSETITLQISRVVLCIQIFAVAVELPKKYMKKHWLSVFMLLVPVMTIGWLVIGLFTWIIFKPLNFSQSLLISGCITATDPVLAAAVVGKGKFAARVPGHLRNLLSAESGCNDGLAFPFIFLAMNLILHAGNAGEIVKEWICVTILYECIFGCLLGAIIGWLARRAIVLAERHGTIDRESFLAFYVMLSFACAGLGAVLGVDELLVAFAAGAAFSWNGQYASKTEDAMVSTAIDLLLNLSYFVYLGAVLPWNFYHQPSLGLPFWKYLLLAIVTIFLRRIPAVLAIWKMTPDLNTWREALFAGHFGPIGVGAIYAAILARSEIEEHSTGAVSSLTTVPREGIENYHLILYLWPVVTFLVVASIVIHGSSVAVIVFGHRLRTMSISMTFTQTQGNANSQSWMSRLPRIDTTGRTFSMHRSDSKAPQAAAAAAAQQPPLSQHTTFETSGVPARPAGGARRRRKFKKHKRLEQRRRPEPENLDLNRVHRDRADAGTAAGAAAVHAVVGADEVDVEKRTPSDDTSPSSSEYAKEKILDVEEKGSQDATRVPTAGYQEGDKIIIDDQDGEVMSVIRVKPERSPGAAPMPDEGQSGSGVRHRASTTSTSATGVDLASLDSSGDATPRRHHLSPISKLESNIATRRRHAASDATKYIAYRVRDEIIIENNDGEILKRYRIHSHGDAPAGQAAAAPTLRQRALSLVGIRPPQQKSREELAEEGGPSQAPVLIPETEGLTHEENALARANDAKIQRKLAGLISETPTARPKKIAALAVDESVPSGKVDVIGVDSETHSPEPFDFGRSGGGDDDESDESGTDEEEEATETDYGSDDDSDDGAVEGETEIERRRRLDALGMGHAERNEEDEEDEILPGTSAVQRGGGMKLKWHSDV